MPPTHVFPDAPPANSVYMTDAPPPYPGINGFNGYTNGAQVEEDGLEYLHKYCSNKIMNNEIHFWTKIVLQLWCKLYLKIMNSHTSKIDDKFM